MSKRGLTNATINHIWAAKEDKLTRMAEHHYGSNLDNIFNKGKLDQGIHQQAVTHTKMNIHIHKPE